MGELAFQWAPATVEMRSKLFPLMQGHEDIVTYLLKQGVPWNAQDKEGNSAGEYALEKVSTQYSVTPVRLSYCS